MPDGSLFPTVKRRAPKAGYATGEKAAYRDAVWSAFAAHCPVPLADAVVAMLPSAEGLEIEAAVARGVKPENIIAIDRSAALLATARWRRVWPEVRCYGNEIGRAFERMAGDGIKVNIANLDLCSQLSEPQVAGVERVAKSGALADRCLVALTALKGRESALAALLLRGLGREVFGAAEGWPERLRVPLACMDEEPWCAAPIAKGEYRSQTQTMLWGVISCRSEAARVRDRDRLVRRLDDEVADLVERTGLARLWSAIDSAQSLREFDRRVDAWRAAAQEFDAAHESILEWWYANEDVRRGRVNVFWCDFRRTAAAFGGSEKEFSRARYPGSRRDYLFRRQRRLLLEGRS